MARTGILLVSHGTACEGILASTQMILGKLDNVRALPLVEGATLEDYEREIELFIDICGGNCLMLVDLQGGTPFNTVMCIARGRQVYAITGMNVPALIVAASERDEVPLDVLERDVASAAREGVVCVGDLIKDLNASTYDEDEDE